MAKKKVEATLVELVGEHQELWQMVDEGETDIEVIMDTLDAVEGEISVKLDGYGHIMRRIELEAAALDAKASYLKKAAKALDDHKKALLNSEDRMKERIMAAMIATGLDETGVKSDSFEFRMVTKGGVLPLVITGEVPQSFMKIEYVPDNDRIREYCEKNECEWAHISPRGKRLDIK